MERPRMDYANLSFIGMANKIESGMTGGQVERKLEASKEKRAEKGKKGERGIKRGKGKRNQIFFKRGE